jgi:hypothetical protein
MTHPRDYPLRFKAICIKDLLPNWKMFHIYKAERNVFGAKLRLRVYSVSYNSYNFDIKEFQEYFTVVEEKDARDKARHK